MGTDRSPFAIFLRFLARAGADLRAVVEIVLFGAGDERRRVAVVLWVVVGDDCRGVVGFLLEDEAEEGLVAEERVMFSGGLWLLLTIAMCISFG